VAIYSTFLQRAFDQVLHDVCLQNLPVVFAIDRAGIVGEDGKTHHGAFDLSYLSCIPNIVISAPRDENELQHLLYTAVRSNRPMAIRYPRGCGCGVPLDSVLHELDIGKSEVLRWGGDVAILTVGSMVIPSLEAAQSLSREGVEARVVNARFVKPLDCELILEVAREVEMVVTVEENVIAGGFGSQVLNLLQETQMGTKRVKCLGLPDRFVEHGPQDFLRSRVGLDASGITEQVLASFTELTEGRKTKALSHP
jgi:1-deoxy-D-xylulose-5-phosphate synthase